MLKDLLQYAFDKEPDLVTVAETLGSGADGIRALQNLEVTVSGKPRKAMSSITLSTFWAESQGVASGSAEEISWHKEEFDAVIGSTHTGGMSFLDNHDTPITKGSECIERAEGDLEKARADYVRAMAFAIFTGSDFQMQAGDEYLGRKQVGPLLEVGRQGPGIEFQHDLQRRLAGTEYDISDYLRAMLTCKKNLGLEDKMYAVVNMSDDDNYLYIDCNIMDAADHSKQAGKLNIKINRILKALPAQLPSNDNARNLTIPGLIEANYEGDNIPTISQEPTRKPGPEPSAKFG